MESRRADPRPQTLHFLQSGCHGKPRLHPPAYDQGLSRPRGRVSCGGLPRLLRSGWLLTRPRAPRAKADTLTTGAGNAKPLLGRGHCPRGPQLSPPAGAGPELPGRGHPW